MRTISCIDCKFTRFYNGIPLLKRSNDPKKDNKSGLHVMTSGYELGTTPVTTTTWAKETSSVVFRLRYFLSTCSGLSVMMSLRWRGRWGDGLFSFQGLDREQQQLRKFIWSAREGGITNQHYTIHTHTPNTHAQGL